MHVPEKPPPFFASVSDDGKLGDSASLVFSPGQGKAMAFFLSGGAGVSREKYPHFWDEQWNYPHWDKIRHWKMPPDFSAEDYWFTLKSVRAMHSRILPLADKNGKCFSFCVPERLQEFLHWLDAKAAVQFSAQGHDVELGGIFDEAFHSSYLEGATTTRRIAADLIRGGRRPKGKSEWLTFNNHRMLQAVYDAKDQPLSPAAILDFHRTLTEGALDAADCGRLRQTDDITVGENVNGGREFHKPSLAAELPTRLAALCDFANGKTPDYFIHPAIRAMLLHFQLAYDHPFVDGNGRTARGLFYWAMERAGYSFVKNTSISRVLVDAPAQYGYAFLYTETDDNDATYFLMHQSNVLRDAVTSTLDYLRNKMAELNRIKKALDKARIHGDFNYRQIALLEHTLRHPDYHYSVKGHCAAHGVSYQTARSDMVVLKDVGLLRQIKARGAGGRRYYVATPNLSVHFNAEI